jgi:hypothetical protein
MTKQARLNARLEPELDKKLAYLCRRTGLATSDVVRNAIELYFDAVQAGGADARTVLETSGFIASGQAPSDLSEQYKNYLSETLRGKLP